MVDLVKNNLGIQVLTDTGWSDFSGLSVNGIKETVSLQLENQNLRLTPDHNVFLPNFTKVEVRSLKPGQQICTSIGTKRVVSVKMNTPVQVYDLVNVSKNNRYYANNILCSNCEFLIFDETLIAPTTLIELAGIDPIERQGQIRWYKKPEKGCTYLVALDPSMGTGGDNAAIQVFELPNLKQVGEWYHNKTIIQKQVFLLKEICAYLADTIGDEHSVYYSVENNTLGEAALLAIDQIGEENIKGIFLSEPARRGSSRAFRKGFNTTQKSKLSACSKLKALIESKRMLIVSKSLVSELKTFVAAGNSYAAKVGDTDDLVMSTILIVRMTQLLQSFDADLDAELRGTVDDFIEPMPWVMVVG